MRVKHQMRQRRLCEARSVQMSGGIRKEAGEVENNEHETAAPHTATRETLSVFFVLYVTITSVVWLSTFGF